MQLSPKSPSVFQNLFVDKKSLPVHNLFLFKQHLIQKNKVKHIKMVIDKPTTEQHFYTLDAVRNSNRSNPNRKASILNDSHLTVLSIRKPQSHLNTIELSPQLRSIQSPKKKSNKHKQLHQILSMHTEQIIPKAVHNKNLNFKFKLYSQEYRNNNTYVVERKKFERSLDEKLKQQVEEKQKLLQQRLEQYKLDVRGKQKFVPMSELLDQKLRKRAKSKDRERAREGLDTLGTK